MKHPEYGFNMLRAYREIPVTGAHVAYQHHERFDGLGYPRQLPQKQILQYAKIAAVVDTFDAVVTDRPYRKGYSTIDGLLILKKLAHTFLDPDIVDAFTSNIAIYPIGSLLYLNTGHTAVVTSVTKINATCPVVNVVSDIKGNFLKPPIEIDLGKTCEVSIERRLNNEETNNIRLKISYANKA